MFFLKKINAKVDNRLKTKQNKQKTHSCNRQIKRKKAENSRENAVTQ